jgi:hypothetical protein
MYNTKAFLPLNIAELIKNNENSNYSIMEMVFNNITNPFKEYVNQEEGNINKLMLGLLKGYEVDESEVYKELGIIGHPYSWLEIPPQYHTIFVVFYFKKDDFQGQLWMPFYSAPDYVVNYDFSYENEKKEYRPNRYGEIHLTPDWFQYLYTKCDDYINKRNEELNKGKEPEVCIPNREQRKKIKEALKIIEENDALPMVDFDKSLDKISLYIIEYYYMNDYIEIRLKEEDFDLDIDELVNRIVFYMIGE